MKNCRIAILILCVLLVMPGCKSVVSDHLIGEPLTSEQAQMYEGVWKVGQGVMHIKHTDGASLVVAGLEWKEDKFVMSQHDVVVTQLGNARFAQMVAENDDGQVDAGQADAATPTDAKKDRPWLLLGLLTSADQNVLVLNSPKFDRFVKAMNDGDVEAILEGDGNTLHVRGDKAALDALLGNPDTLQTFFDIENPGVLIPVGKLD